MLKRINDVVVSATMLILLSPVLLLVALAVRLTSRGPIIFSQQRVGLNLRQKKRDRRQRGDQRDLPDGVERRGTGINRRRDDGYGKPFTLYKFRTMRIDAEKNGAQFAVKGDPRVTCIGRFMRKTRLDELPQLWNVLRGEMSLVGPRPHALAHDRFFEKRIAMYPRRLNVKPGITGWAQVNGYRGATDTDEAMSQRVSHDLYYIDNWSLTFDLHIMLLTVISSKAQMNAY